MSSAAVDHRSSRTPTGGGLRIRAYPSSRSGKDIDLTVSCANDSSGWQQVLSSKDRPIKATNPLGQATVGGSTTGGSLVDTGSNEQISIYKGCQPTMICLGRLGIHPKKGRFRRCSQRLEVTRIQPRVSPSSSRCVGKVRTSPEQRAVL